MNQKELLSLKRTAAEIRKSIIEAVFSAGSGHPGGSLSCADIMTLLYYKHMNVDPKNPKNPDRDRFVMSKGHATPVLYAVLAEKGFFPKEDLTTFRQADSYLEGHPSLKDVPGVDMTTGSLGQGICAACGIAQMGKLDKKDYRVYSILGDGEIQEGQVWEAMMYAAHYKLDNLTAFLDHNGLQIDGDIKDIMSPEPVVDKFKAFGWEVIQVDGHDLEEVDKAIEKAKTIKGKPTMIVAETIKGKGVSYMENEYGWHGKAPDQALRDKAIAEIEAYIKGLEV